MLAGPRTEPGNMRPLEITRSGILATVAVFIVAAICIRLGLWQLDRRDQRNALNRAIAERLESPPVAVDALPLDTVGLTYRRAVVDGRFQGSRSIVLGGRSYRGTPGAHVITPVLLADGAVLANRGWLPAPDAATIDPAAMRTTADVRLEGVLLPFPRVESEEPPPDEFEETWFRLDGRRIRAQYPYPVAPLYLQLTEPADAAGAETTAAEDPEPVPAGLPQLDPGPHLSYAVQWFSFAAIFIIGWAALLLVRRRPGPSVGAPPPG